LSTWHLRQRAPRRSFGLARRRVYPLWTLGLRRQRASASPRQPWQPLLAASEPQHRRIEHERQPKCPWLTWGPLAVSPKLLLTMASRQDSRPSVRASWLVEALLPSRERRPLDQPVTGRPSKSRQSKASSPSFIPQRPKRIRLRTDVSRSSVRAHLRAATLPFRDSVIAFVCCPPLTEGAKQISQKQELTENRFPSAGKKMLQRQISFAWRELRSMFES